jgi:ABC-type dipeptide/oligopeptide/nickel transport system ATPase subunit
MNIQSIELQNLTYEPLFENLSIELRQGDCCKIEGPSGVGKTTLLKILAQEIKNTHLRGENKVAIKGTYQLNDTMHTPHSTERPNDVIVGIQYQSTLSSYAPYLSFEKQIIPPLARIKKTSHRQAISILQTYMKALGLDLPDLLKRKPHQISGGQLQRLDLAFLIALDPKVFLLDEPFTGLDSVNAMKTVLCLQNLLKRNKFILFSSHQPILNSSLKYKTISLKLREIEELSKRTNPNEEDVTWIPLPQACVTLRAQITKTFFDKTTPKKMVLLDNICIQTQKEDNCLGIVGASGKGKSTLIKILAGLSSPDPESILEFSKSQPSKRLLFQSSISALNPKQTIEQHFREIEKDILRKGMDTLDLKDEWLRRYPTEISGGQLQRFVFLKTILQAPEILLLDEPFVGLDRKQVDTMVRILQYIVRQRRTTLVIASHENETLENIMTRKVVI